LASINARSAGAIFAGIDVPARATDADEMSETTSTRSAQLNAIGRRVLTPGHPQHDLRRARSALAG
jgi:hypothetical protein